MKTIKRLRKQANTLLGQKILNARIAYIQRQANPQQKTKQEQRKSRMRRLGTLV